MRRLLIAIPMVLFLLLAVAVVMVIIGVQRNRLRSIDVTEGAVSAASATYEVRLVHDGRDRHFYLHVPPAAAAGEALPLLLVLHGGGTHAADMAGLARFIDFADREGVLVAFPDGVEKNWNDGRTDVPFASAKEDVDDTGFLRAVVANTSATLPVDTRRIYSAGISNGALMSSRLACEASDLIAGVALVAGTAPEGLDATCRPARAPSVIAFLGTDDPLIPYEGGDVQAFLPILKRGRVMGAEALKRFWVAANGCNPGPAVSEAPDFVKNDGSRVYVEVFGGCRDGAGVTFYRIEGGGHTWPGGVQYLQRHLVGPTNRDIDALEVMWRFFEEHPRQ